MTASTQVTHTGRIAARIDRLPLAWPQWRLALISQLFWGVIIAADGIPARLYPFTWGPEHAFGLGAFSILLAVQFGVGILVGEYLIGVFSDRFGRRAALLASSIVIAVLLWPTALTNNFGLLLLFFGLSSIGMGGVLSLSGRTRAGCPAIAASVLPRRYRLTSTLRFPSRGGLLRCHGRSSDCTLVPTSSKSFGAGLARPRLGCEIAIALT